MTNGAAKSPYLGTNPSLPGLPWNKHAVGCICWTKPKGLYNLLETAPSAAFWLHTYSIAWLSPSSTFVSSGWETLFPCHFLNNSGSASLQDVGTEYQGHSNTGGKLGGIFQTKTGLIEGGEHLFSCMFTSSGDIINLPHFLRNMRILCFIFLCFLVAKV